MLPYVTLKKIMYKSPRTLNGNCVTKPKYGADIGVYVHKSNKPNLIVISDQRLEFWGSAFILANTWPDAGIDTHLITHSDPAKVSQCMYFQEK